MTYKRTITELEDKAVLWWPDSLSEANANASAIPTLLETQDRFLKVLSLSTESPYQIFDVLEATRLPANIFLKHLCILADFGGEPIKRLAREFKSIFGDGIGNYSIQFSWKSQRHRHEFKALPVNGLGNPSLHIDGKGLNEPQKLNDLYRDMAVILLFGSTSTVSEQAGLNRCEIGTLLGDESILENYVKQRYIVVSKITSGATANTLGQLAEAAVVSYLHDALDSSYTVSSSSQIELVGHERRGGGMPFDIVVERGKKKAGIEVSFQVTTNSVIERKAGQAQDRMNLMHSNGHAIAYVVDGAGNMERQAAGSTIRQNSDCTVAFSDDEFQELTNWLRKTL